MASCSNNPVQSKLKNELVDEDFIEPLLLSQLVGGGITVEDINNLQQAGLCTVKSIICTPTNVLVKIKGITQQKAIRLKSGAEKLVPIGFTTASNAQAVLSKGFRISTGCEELDGILGGGVEGNASITEIFGESSTGKSQLCYSLAVSSMVTVGARLGSGLVKCLYIETEGKFRPERLADIAQRYEMDGKLITDNVTYARAYTAEHQMQLLTKIGELLTKAKYGLIIIDSCTALFRLDYGGLGNLSSRQYHLGQYLRGLRRLADEFNIGVVITNQVLADIDSSTGNESNSPGSDIKPVGGHVMAHASTTRIGLRKGLVGGTFIAKLHHSSYLPQAEAVFRIRHNEGVQ